MATRRSSAGKLKKPAAKPRSGKPAPSPVPPIKSSARTTVSGPSTGLTAAPPGDAAAAKFAGTEALAEQFPFNAAKSSEFGDAGAAVGHSTAPPDPMITGSTLTETNASPKIGSGNPQKSFNPSSGSLDRVRVDSGGQALTTNQGVPVADNQNSLKARAAWSRSA